MFSALSSVSPSACACCRASSLVSGGAAAARSTAAACPSGERAKHSAASSAVAKRPRCTSLPPRHSCVWKGLVLRESRCTPKKPVLVSATRSVSPSACACCRTSSLVSGGAVAALCAASLPSGDRATHSAASSAVTKVHAEVARRVVGHAQRQPLRLRLLPHLLARQRRRRCIPLRRCRLPLWRPRDAQRRLLGGGEAAQVHLLATAPHLHLVGLGMAGVLEIHAQVARLVVGHEQRQPLRRRLRSPHQRSPTRRDRQTKQRNKDADMIAAASEASSHASLSAQFLR
eukprot:scaffold130644_cov57-Phaeocystis_antarctica.AAC.1